jgi:hypothetical protein
MKQTLLIVLIGIFIFPFIFLSCKKDSAQNNTPPRLQVRLMDSPGDYEAVYIDVKDVQINVTGDTVNGWQSLPGVNAGVYDLLRLVNGKDTILANAEIPSGRLHQLRLILGTENYVKIEGTSQQIKLQTPSAQQSGLKINIQMDVQNGILYTISLDFDAARSINKTGNNKYMLKPVIRAILNAVGGSIKGVVIPKTFQSAIYAVQGIDTVASTFTDTNGGYLIKGLPAGTYSVFYRPGDNTYKDSLRNNISVLFNVVTKIDTTFLHQ